MTTLGSDHCAQSGGSNFAEYRGIGLAEKGDSGFADKGLVDLLKIEVVDL